jgi:23S rRNA (guanine745-N1)-methyltransferase
LEDPQDIQNLFKMTPYYYKTGSKDQEKLNRLSSLQTQLGFAVQVYRKVD